MECQQRFERCSAVDLVLLPPVVVPAVFPSSDANETQSDQEGTVQRAMRSEHPLNLGERGIRIIIENHNKNRHERKIGSSSIKRI